MKKIIIVFVLILIGCSQKNIVQKSSIQGENNRPKETIITIKNLEAKKHLIQGLTYSLQDLPEKAILEFQEALMYDDSPAIRYALSLQLLKLNKLDLALKYLSNVLELPDSSIHLDYLLLAAQIYLNRGDLNSATDALERIIRMDSTNISAIFNLAQVVESKDIDRARKLYEYALQIQPENRSVLESLLNIYYNEKNYQSAESILKELIYNEPFDPELRIRLINLYHEWGKPDSANKILNEVIERFPDYFYANLYLIENQINEKRYDEVRATIKSLYISNKDNKDNLQALLDYISLMCIKDTTLSNIIIDFLNENDKQDDSLSVVYLFLMYSLNGDEAQANNFFNKIDRENPTQLEILKKFGIQFYIDGSHDASIFVLQKIQPYFKDDFDLTVTLGEALLVKERYNESINYLKKASDLNQNNPELLTAISFTLGKLKLYDEAIEYAEKALSLDNKNKNAMINLGILLDNAGYFSRCDSFYEEALKIYPDESTLLNNYAYSLAKRKVKLDRALELSKKSLEKDSLVASYLDTLGWIYFQMGMIEEAEKYIKMAIEHGSNSSEVLEHMGDVYMRLNNTEEAKVFYRMALQIDPENRTIQQKLKEIE